jgi:hypothetical protein
VMYCSVLFWEALAYGLGMDGMRPRYHIYRMGWSYHKTELNAIFESFKLVHSFQLYRYRYVALLGRSTYEYTISGQLSHPRPQLPNSMEYIPIDWRLDLMSNFMQSDGPLSTGTLGVYLEPYATVTHSVDISLEPCRHGLL